MTPSAYLALGLLAVLAAWLVFDFFAWKRIRKERAFLRAWIRHLHGDDR